MPLCNRFLSLVLVGILGLVALNAHADTAMLGASKDSTIINDANGAVANGAGQLISGQTGGSGPGAERALLAFDIAGAIPAGATITGAELTLNVTMSGRSSGLDEYTLHTVDQDWGEGASIGFSGLGAASGAGDSTWIHTFFDTATWNTPGGDFDATPSATEVISGSGPVTWSSTEMVADVQAWLDNPSANFGWILIGDENIPATARMFDSRESSSNPPLLTVMFESGTVVPEPASLGLGLIGCLLSSNVLRRQRVR